MNYPEIEKEIIELTNIDNFRGMETTRSFALKRVSLLIELEKVRQLNELQITLVHIKNYMTEV